jgi:hypothetical protein
LPEANDGPVPPFVLPCETSPITRLASRLDHPCVNVPPRMRLPELPAEVDPLAALKEMLERVATPMRVERPPREVSADAKVQDALEQRTPQFILRNTPRLERDPEDVPAWVVKPSGRAEVDADLGEVRSARHRPPELLREWMLDQVKAARREQRERACALQWSQHFGREAREARRREKEEAAARESEERMGSRE